MPLSELDLTNYISVGDMGMIHIGKIQTYVLQCNVTVSLIHFFRSLRTSYRIPLWHQNTNAVAHHGWWQWLFLSFAYLCVCVFEVTVQSDLPSIITYKLCKGRRYSFILVCLFLVWMSWNIKYMYMCICCRILTDRIVMLVRGSAIRSWILQLTCIFWMSKQVEYCKRVQYF